MIKITIKRAVIALHWQCPYQGEIQNYFSPVLMERDVNASSAVVYSGKNNLPEKIAPTLGDGVAVRGCLVRLTGNGVKRATKTEF